MNQHIQKSKLIIESEFLDNYNYTCKYTINKCRHEVGYIYYHPYDFNVDDTVIVLDSNEYISTINLILISLQLNKYFYSKQRDIENYDDLSDIPIIILDEEGEKDFIVNKLFKSFGLRSLNAPKYYELIHLLKIFGMSWDNELNILDEMEKDEDLKESNDIN